MQGIPVVGRIYVGGWWDWLTPFSLMTGVALVIGYALLGAGWLIYKTEGELQDAAYRFAKITGIATLALIGAVSLWTPFLNEAYMDKWLTFPRMIFTAPVPLLVLACAWLLYSGIEERRELQPFLASLGLFVLCFIGIGISFYPVHRAGRGDDLAGGRAG